MAQRYSIAEARSALPSIVDEAEAGVEIQLTRRGKPVAAVIGLSVLEHLRGERRHFGTAYREFLEQHRLDEIGIDRDFCAPFREKSAGRKVTL